MALTLTKTSLEFNCNSIPACLTNRCNGSSVRHATLGRKCYTSRQLNVHGTQSSGIQLQPKTLTASQRWPPCKPRAPILKPFSTASFQKFTACNCNIIHSFYTQFLSVLRRNIVTSVGIIGIFN